MMIKGSGLPPFLVGVAEQSRGKQNSKIKMQNDRARESQKSKLKMTDQSLKMRKVFAF
jgi:hypothetical protein